MRIAGSPIRALQAREVETIHQNALRILAEMGMEIQNQALLEDLAAVDFPVDFGLRRVYFPRPLVEKFIADAEKYDWERAEPALSVTAGVYQSLYQNPQTGQLEPWNAENLAFYFHLARSLPHIDNADMLGCRLPVPDALEPLYERYYSWKYGAGEGGSIYQEDLCPYLLDLYRIRAARKNKPIEQVFRGSVYLVPPLKLGVHEAAQLQYFREQGLRVRIGSMHSMGGSAPVTLAGVVTLNLAEQLALRMVEWAWFGSKRLHFSSSIAVMDMRTTSYRSAPVERPMANLMMAQMAQFYGASFRAHGNLTDAKQPTPEAGMQKTLTALPLFLAGGDIWMPAGLLSADQICSPLQLVLDNELMGAARQFLKSFDVSAESIGIEDILAAGPGGHFYDREHTARHMRSAIYYPAVWQRSMLQTWLEDGGKTDLDAAKAVVQQAWQNFCAGPPSFLAEDEEAEIMKLIQAAGARLVSNS